MTQKQNHTDPEILALVKQGGSDLEDVSKYMMEIYKGYIPKVGNKLKLEISILNDAYVDALVKLIRQIKTDQYRSESKLSTYFYSIFYNTCVDVLRKKTTHLTYIPLDLNDYDLKEKDLLEIINVKEEAQTVLKKIDQMGDPCKSILVDWAYWGYSMDEIAIRSGLANAESARSMKYKCLKKLRSFLNFENPKS